MIEAQEVLKRCSAHQRSRVPERGTRMQSPSPIAELRGITKRFPGILAFDRVDLKVYSGEIHALLGENGAGKSTLMKILYGQYQPDAGKIWLDGMRTVMRSPKAAIRAGIGMVFPRRSRRRAARTSW